MMSPTNDLLASDEEGGSEDKRLASGHREGPTTEAPAQSRSRRRTASPSRAAPSLGRGEVRQGHSSHATALSIDVTSSSQPWQSRERTLSRRVMDALGWVPGKEVARHTLGIALLLLVVCLWTTSNFLASYMFSDDTYSKPFFVTYANSSAFPILLFTPMLTRSVMRHGISGVKLRIIEAWRGEWHAVDSTDSSPTSPAVKPSRSSRHAEEGLIGANEAGRSEACEALLADADGIVDDETDSSAAAASTAAPFRRDPSDSHERLTVRETARVGFEFSLLWFAANYFASACLKYTSVGSVTILTSTSGVWTLLFCAATGVEAFTSRKLAGVLASLAGIILVSSVDMSGQSDEDRGQFPYKSPGEMAVGDALALISAVAYGVYVTVMKRRVGNEERVNMPLFFGFVGLSSMLLMWPGFVFLHLTGLETFELPSSAKIWTLVALNSMTSFISDMAWAYAMLLTTPLVVTVGLSLTIPLSLIGQMFQYAQYSSWVYWVGAGVVICSFLFINHESIDPTEAGKVDDGDVEHA